MDMQKLVATRPEVCSLGAPLPRRPFHRATSEEKDPSYLPFSISKRWEPKHEAERKRRFTQKWTLEQMHALEDGVET